MKTEITVDHYLKTGQLWKKAPDREVIFKVDHEPGNHPPDTIVELVVMEPLGISATANVRLSDLNRVIVAICGGSS